MTNRFTKVFFILFFLCSLLLGCSQETGSGEKIEENIQFSNIRFPNMALKEEESAHISRVEEMLKTAVLITGDQDFLQMTNTTSEALKIEFYISIYNETGALVDSRSIRVNSFPEGGKLLYGLYSDYAKTGDRAEIVAEFQHGNSYYRTNPIPLAVQEPQKEQELPATIRPKDILPVEITVSSFWGENKYRLCSFSYEKDSTLDDVYNITVQFEKLSADGDKSDSIDYRIVGENGTVAYSDNFYIRYLNEGEVAELVDSYINLPPGDYYFEILEKE